MNNYYWLKLHYDLLDDWKVGTLPDSLKWRFIQCLLVAGETRQDGYLPPLNQFAFRIRPMTPEALRKDLSHLADAELVELKVDETGQERWFVSNFKKRQAKKTAAERKRAQRERARDDSITNKSQTSHEPVTTRDTDKIRLDTDIDTDKIKNNDSNSSDFAAVVSAYENNIAPITPIMSETIQEALDEFGAEDIVEAIGLAVKADVRKWAYVNGILKRWRKNGKQKRNIVKVENGGGMYV